MATNRPTLTSRNPLGTGRALFLDQRRRRWQHGGPIIRAHKELFVRDRPAGMSRRDAIRHWEHIFAGYRDSPYAAHWAATAAKVTHAVAAR